MRYVKILGLAAVAAAALMAFVGASSASATVLCTTKTNEGTCPVGWSANLDTIHAVSETEKPTLTGGFKNVECESSTVSVNEMNEGSATETVKGVVEALTFTNCNCTVVVVKNGTLEVHWIPPEPGKESTNGTLTSSGATVTVNCSTIFGTVHCNYVTENTDLGTLTGSSATGGTATIDVTAEIPREKTSELCNEQAIWHAKYLVTSPDYLDVGKET
jgi:hypothetical protein